MIATAEKLSSKLNFDDSDSEEDESDESASKESKQIPPKIQGLRVVVDTTKIKKNIGKLKVVLSAIAWQNISRSVFGIRISENLISLHHIYFFF